MIVNLCVRAVMGSNAAVDFQMPPICSPHVRPGRPIESICVINEQLSNALARYVLVIICLVTVSLQSRYCPRCSKCNALDYFP